MRASGRRESWAGGLGDRVVCNAGWRRIGRPRVELFPSHGGCSSTRCLRAVWLRRRYRPPWVLETSCRTGSFGSPGGGASRGGPVELWSLGDPIAEAGTSEAVSSEGALERRARRTHCGRPCYSLVGVGCPARMAVRLRVRPARVVPEGSSWSSIA